MLDGWNSGKKNVDRKSGTEYNHYYSGKYCDVDGTIINIYHLFKLLIMLYHFDEDVPTFFLE